MVQHRWKSKWSAGYTKSLMKSPYTVANRKSFWSAVIIILAPSKLGLSYAMALYEDYFIYKTEKANKKYSFQEYVVYNLYNGHFKAPYSTPPKKWFFLFI